MKQCKILMIGLVLTALLIPSICSAVDLGKVAYVDLSLLFDEYYKTKEYDVVLEGKHKEIENMLKEKLEKIKESQGKLALLNEDKKSELEDEIEKKKKELLDLEQQERANLTKERNEKIREILLEIEKVVSSYAEKEGYSIILNDRVLIYGEQSLNITEKILTILNEKK